MPRILIAGFCALPGPDRAGVQLRHIMRALLRHHSVDMLVLRRGDQAYVERWGSARLLRVPVPDGDFRTRVEAFRRALRRQLEGADYDVVHFRDGWSGIPVLEMREQLKYAAVFDVARSPLAEPVLLSREEVARLEQDHDECLRRADAVLAPHEPARRYLASRCGRDRVHLVPPGVDVDAFDWEEPEAKGPPRVLYTGSLTPGRGVRVLLRAWLDVSRHTDARLVLAGQSNREFLKSLQTAVRDLDLGGKVEFAGELEHEDVPSCIAQAAICIAPGAVELGSHPLGLYPTKILEYMACQRAVIAPRRGTVTMLARDGQHGLLFEPGQPAHLAEQILRLLRDGALRSRLARAGYELVRQAHTASGTRRQLRKAYNWLASQSPWRERFLEAIEELPASALVQIPTAEVTEASEWQEPIRRPAPERPIRAFDSDLVVVLDDDTDARQIETTVSEVADVTRVEESPLVRPGDERRPRPEPLATAVDARPLDEWVVDDTRNRIEPAGEAEGTPVDLEPPVASTPPIETRFVAGELDVPTPAPRQSHTVEPPDVEVELDEQNFTAVTPPFGMEGGSTTTRKTAEPEQPDEDSATQIAAAPPPARSSGPAPSRQPGQPPPVPPGRSKQSSKSSGTRSRKTKPVDDLT